MWSKHLELEEQALQGCADGVSEAHISGIRVAIHAICVEGAVEAGHHPGGDRAVHSLQIAQDPGKLLGARRKIVLSGELQEVDRPMVEAVPVKDMTSPS